MRDLTPGERRVFEEVRSFWGTQVSMQDVFFEDSQGAMIAPTAPDGEIYVFIGLTSLALFLDEGVYDEAGIRQSIMGPFAQGVPDSDLGAVWSRGADGASADRKDQVRAAPRLEGGHDVTEPNFAGSSMNARGATRPVSTLQQTFKLARITCGSLPFVAALLLFVTWIMSTDGGISWTTLGAVRPELAFILGVGLVVAASSRFIAGSMGRRAAEKWAAAGHRVDDVVFERPTSDTGLDLSGSPAIPQTLRTQFSMASVTGCAVPEMLLLTGFVVTIASSSGVYMLVATVIYFPLWASNFPRRATWDAWAASAGLTLPWDGPGMGTPAQAPPPADSVVPR